MPDSRRRQCSYPNSVQLPSHSGSIRSWRVHWPCSGATPSFERPLVPFESFLIGIGLHDRAYGPLDNLPIGAIPEDEWLALTHSGFEMSWADPVADLITKLHL